MEVFYFPIAEKGDTQTPLSVFLSFLASQGKGGMPRFSFVDASASLFPHLSLKENIYLNSLSPTLGVPLDEQFNQKMRKTENACLGHLYHSIPNIGEQASKADLRCQKIAALVKGFLQDSDYLLLNCPEEHLSSKECELLLSTLQWCTLSMNRGTILLMSPKESLWMSHATHLVYRNVDRSFAVRPRPKLVSVPEKKSGHLVFQNFPMDEKKAA